MGIKCRHCGNSIHASWKNISYKEFGKTDFPMFTFKKNTAPFSVSIMNCPECSESLIKWTSFQEQKGTDKYIHPITPYIGTEFVPESLKDDFIEACKLLDISPKASAAFSRKCLETILTERGFKQDNLYQKIEAAEKETNDVDKAFPKNMRKLFKVIQKFGNFGVHKTTYKNSNEIINIEPEEAEFCIDLIERLIEYCYEEPEKDDEIDKKFSNKVSREKE